MRQHFFCIFAKNNFQTFTAMDEQILINYTPTEEGFTLSLTIGNTRIFDYQTQQHNPSQQTLDIIAKLGEIKNIIE